MAESTCFLRSLYNPTDISGVAKEDSNQIHGGLMSWGDPICAKLGESISFGRFITESLAWEKWSAFSHNRYVEEAKKFSRPGSVAEKRAYFEAYYRKKVAERPAALIQEANDSANITSDSEAQDGTCNNSSTEIRSKADSNVTVVEQRDNDAVNCIVDYADQNKYKSDIEQSEVDISRVERSEEVPEPRVDTNPSVENSSLVYNSNSNQFVNVEGNKKIAIPKDDGKPDTGPTGQEIQASSVRRREVTSSLKSPSKTGAAKLSYSLAEKKAAQQAENRINSALGSKKSAGGSFEKKRLIGRSLHMSINLPSSVGVTSKTTSVSVNRTRTKKVDANLPKGALNEVSSNPQSEGTSFLKSSSATRISPRLSTTSYPFKFRSEERAAKRKEFFQRLDEIKSQEVEKGQVQKRCKKKTEHDPKKLQQNSGSKSKPNTNINDGLQSPSNETRKVLVTPPRSPNLGRKANSWKLRKPPNPITTNNFELVAKKINQRTRHSVTSLVRKITWENASPNIQR